MEDVHRARYAVDEVFTRRIKLLADVLNIERAANAVPLPVTVPATSGLLPAAVSERNRAVRRVVRVDVKGPVA